MMNEVEEEDVVEGGVQITPEQYFELMKGIFDQIDADKSGYIDREELSNFLKGFAESMDAPIPDENALKMTFKLLDENEDGQISFEEVSGLLDSIVKIILGEFDQEYQTMQYQRVLEDQEMINQAAETIFVRSTTA